MPIVFITPLFVLAGAAIASLVARKYPENLFRNTLILGTIIVVIDCHQK